MALILIFSQFGAWIKGGSAINQNFFTELILKWFEIIFVWRRASRFWTNFGFLTRSDVRGGWRLVTQNFFSESELWSITHFQSLRVLDPSHQWFGPKMDVVTPAGLSQLTTGAQEEGKKWKFFHLLIYYLFYQFNQSNILRRTTRLSDGTQESHLI